MEKKLTYVPPTVQVTRVVLEQGITVGSIIDTKGMDVYEWDSVPEDQGDIWLPI